MKPVKKTPLVFFNASVVLAGLKSPEGGSGELLKWCSQTKIKGIISEIILDEVARNIGKIGLNKKKLKKAIFSFGKICSAPQSKSVERFNS